MSSPSNKEEGITLRRSTRKSVVNKPEDNATPKKRKSMAAENAVETTGTPRRSARSAVTPRKSVGAVISTPSKTSQSTETPTKKKETITPRKTGIPSRKSVASTISPEVAEDPIRKTPRRSVRASTVSKSPIKEEESTPAKRTRKSVLFKDTISEVHCFDEDSAPSKGKSLPSPSRKTRKSVHFKDSPDLELISEESNSITAVNETSISSPLPKLACSPKVVLKRISLTMKEADTAELSPNLNQKDDSVTKDDTNEALFEGGIDNLCVSPSMFLGSRDKCATGSEDSSVTSSQINNELKSPRRKLSYDKKKDITNLNQDPADSNENSGAVNVESLLKGQRIPFHPSPVNVTTVLALEEDTKVEGNNIPADQTQSEYSESETSLKSISNIDENSELSKLEKPNSSQTLECCDNISLPLVLEGKNQLVEDKTGNIKLIDEEASLEKIDLGKAGIEHSSEESQCSRSDNLSMTSTQNALDDSSMSEMSSPPTLPGPDALHPPKQSDESSSLTDENLEKPTSHSSIEKTLENNEAKINSDIIKKHEASAFLKTDSLAEEMPLNGRNSEDPELIVSPKGKTAETNNECLKNSPNDLSIASLVSANSTQETWSPLKLEVSVSSGCMDSSALDKSVFHSPSHEVTSPDLNSVSSFSEENQQNIGKSPSVSKKQNEVVTETVVATTLDSGAKENCDPETKTLNTVSSSEILENSITEESSLSLSPQQVSSSQSSTLLTTFSSAVDDKSLKINDSVSSGSVSNIESPPEELSDVKIENVEKSLNDSIQTSLGAEVFSKDSHSPTKPSECSVNSSEHTTPNKSILSPQRMESPNHCHLSVSMKTESSGSLVLEEPSLTLNSLTPGTQKQSLLAESKEESEVEKSEEVAPSLCTEKESCLSPSESSKLSTIESAEPSCLQGKNSSILCTTSLSPVAENNSLQSEQVEESGESPTFAQSEDINESHTLSSSKDINESQCININDDDINGLNETNRSILESKITTSPSSFVGEEKAISSAVDKKSASLSSSQISTEESLKECSYVSSPPQNARKSSERNSFSEVVSSSDLVHHQEGKECTSPRINSNTCLNSSGEGDLHSQASINSQVFDSSSEKSCKSSEDDEMSTCNMSILKQECPESSVSSVSKSNEDVCSSGNDSLLTSETKESVLSTSHSRTSSDLTGTRTPPNPSDSSTSDNDHESTELAVDNDSSLENFKAINDGSSKKQSFASPKRSPPSGSGLESVNFNFDMVENPNKATCHVSSIDSLFNIEGAEDWNSDDDIDWSPNSQSAGCTESNYPKQEINLAKKKYLLRSQKRSKNIKKSKAQVPTIAGTFSISEVMSDKSPENNYDPQGFTVSSNEHSPVAVAYEPTDFTIIPVKTSKLDLHEVPGKRCFVNEKISETNKEIETNKSSKLQKPSKRTDNSCFATAVLPCRLKEKDILKSFDEAGVDGIVSVSVTSSDSAVIEFSDKKSLKKALNLYGEIFYQGEPIYLLKAK